MPASRATTARRLPAVAYRIPFTINGVPSYLVLGARSQVVGFKRHATSSLSKLLALIWSNGE